MDNSEKQQQRMRRYFIDATKEILRGEGLKVVSARNIASRAGYSYATLYNYFKDINSLVFECVKDFQAELNEQILAAGEQAAPGLPRLKAGLRAWINYFIQYPGIFELFFLERMGDIGHKTKAAEIILNSTMAATSEGLRELADAGAITSGHAEELGELFRYSITGLMLYHSNRRYPPDYQALMEALERQTDLLLSIKPQG